MSQYSDMIGDTVYSSLGPRPRGRKSPPRRKRKRSRPDKREQEETSWGRELWLWGRTLVLAVVFVLLLHVFVFNLSTVDGQSMEPTLFEKEWLYIDKLTLRFVQPHLGDVIIIKDPAEWPEQKQYLVKRVVGAPGDTVEVRGGKLYRNGEPVAEPYTDTAIEDPDYGPVKVDDGSYFVMGDNRHARASRDSRSFGPVPRGMIVGKADFIVWPFSKLDAL